MKNTFCKYLNILVRLFLISLFCYSLSFTSNAQNLNKKYFKGKTLYIDNTTLTKSIFNIDTLNLIDYPNYTREFCESHSSLYLSFCKSSKTISLEFSKNKKLNVSEFDAIAWTVTVLKLNWKWKFDEAANTLIIYSNVTPNMKFVINDDKTINFKSSLSPSDRNLRLIKLIKVKD